MPVDVLHVTQPVSAGVARCVADLAVDQARRGWDVAVASPLGGELDRLLGGAPVERVSWEARRSPGPSVAGETWQLGRIVAARVPRVVHLHSAKAGLAGRLAIRGRRPTVFQPHAWSFDAADGLVRAASLRWERYAVRWTDVLVAVSAAERESGLAQGIAAPGRVVPNGVDLARFATDGRAAARATLGVTAPLVVCVGRLSHQKGQDLLLDAWPAVVAQVPDAQLVLVGDGPLRGALEARAPDSVRFAGAQDDPAPWLTAADVVVLPSRWEGMSLVLLEAMASGCSIVATAVSGTTEALGDTGGVVLPEDPRALTGALTERLLDEALRDREGAAARLRVEQRHSLTAMLDAVAEVYEPLFARSS